MLIIFGFRTLLHVIGVGDFHCPHCDSDRRYEKVQPRRWFTLFFIPIIPGTRQDPVVRCMTCRSLWDEQVLALPTTQELQEGLAVAARAVIATTVARLPNVAVPSALAIATVEVARYQPSSYSVDELLRDVASFRSCSVRDYAEPVAPILTTIGKERLVRGALTVVAAYCMLSEVNSRGYQAALANVESAAASLGLTHSHFFALGQESASEAAALIERMANEKAS